jgi:hypothetical protein
MKKIIRQFATKSNPPPAEGFMHGLSESRYLHITAEQALLNPELKLSDSIRY